MQQVAPSNRIQSVDALRSIAIFAVIAIHTTPFKTQSLPISDTLNIAIVINQLARFAVPFFFILSGYFWAGKFSKTDEIFGPTVALAKRTAILFFAWSLIYLLPWGTFNSIGRNSAELSEALKLNISNVLENPFTALTQGTKGHLWFLASLLCSLGISSVLIRAGLTGLLAVLSVTLYAIGLAGGAYSDSPLGFHAAYNFRNGPFFSLIFFVTGYFLQMAKPHRSWFSIGLLVAAIGVAIHFSELLILKLNWGTTMAQDYVFGTYFFGMGVAMMALSNSSLFSFRGSGTIGPLVPGIYVSHLIFVDLLAPADRAFSAFYFWSFLYPALVFLLSYLFAWFLSKFSFTRNLVK